MKFNHCQDISHFAVRRIICSVCLFFFAGAYAQQPVTYVDPYIGSGGHGHVFVGASVPFGAVQAGPENFYKGWDWCSGYNYGDSVMIGFAHTHLNGTGIGDLADVLIMPYTGAVKTDKGIEKNPGSGYASRYSHATEKVKPGYYAVTLSDHQVKAELTATERTAFHRYYFPEGKEAHIIIDLKEGINDQSTETCIKKTGRYTLEGYRFSRGWAKNQWLFFAIRSSVPLDNFSIYENNSRLDGDSATGKAIKAVISLGTSPGLVQWKVGISPVSAANGLANIEAEIPAWDFAGTVKLAETKWNKELAKIKIETASEKIKRIFYTSLYHTMIDPALFNDHNSDYRGTDKKVYAHADFENYSVFSLWDTYRAVHPLYTIMQPQRTADMINSMLAIYQQQGKLPIWHLMGNETGTMVGISSLQVIAEAFLKGCTGFDAKAAYEAVKATAMSDSLGLMYVKDLKPIPSDIQRRSVAKALEYCISDASIALMAKKLKHEDDYRYFLKRSRNYFLYYDSINRFFRGRPNAGGFSEPFNSLKSNEPWGHDYAEGNAWQYLWLVPHDVNGLVTLMGGREAFLNRLDSFFALQAPHDAEALVDLTGLIGQYAHGNEPSHHITYLYAMMGQPWKTAEKVRYILNDMYHDRPDGIIGNDDCGQMAAWYIFSALGFYPVFPAGGEYVFGSPLLEKAVLSLPNGRKLVIKAPGATSRPYIKKITFNGRRYNSVSISHAALMAGGTLEFEMSDKPVRTYFNTGYNND